MPKDITVTVYEYNELNAKAKVKAMQWFLECSMGDVWWKDIYEDAKTIGLEITSFDRIAEGKLILTLRQSIDAILANHGEICNTHEIAVKYKERLDKPRGKRFKMNVLSELLTKTYLRELLAAYHTQLMGEQEYLSSDEYLAEGIEANGYTFTKDGKHFG